MPEKIFERLKLTNIDLITKNVADLKIEAEKLLNFPHKELGKCSKDKFYCVFHMKNQKIEFFLFVFSWALTEFIYCGTVLENEEQSLQEYGVRSGTMIQVFQKQYDMEYKSEQATSEQIHKTVASYRAVFKEMASSSAVTIAFVSFYLQFFSFTFNAFHLHAIFPPEIFQRFFFC